MSYKYSPLKLATGPNGEFRLLTILPGLEGENIKCMLKNASISSPPRYEALSYTWGDPKGVESKFPVKGNPNQSFTIAVNGQHAEVRYNLNAALFQLRHQTEPRVVWIDAICIDQRNDSEKSEQVQLMARIYSQASKAIIWLGEDDEYVDIAFDTSEQFCWVVKVRVWQYCSEKLRLPLSEITEDMVAALIESEKGRSSELPESPFTSLKRDTSNLLRAFSTIPVDFSNATDLVRMASDKFGQDSLPAHMLSNQRKLSEYPGWHERIEALEEVFWKRNYWHRLWVVQELMSATETLLLSGKRQMDGTIVHCFLLAIHRGQGSGGSLLLSNCDRDAADKLQFSLTWFYIPELWKGVYQTFYTTWSVYFLMVCSEPRDHIYALLSIVRPIDITIDYSQPVVDVFTDATRSIIAQEQHLNILCINKNIHGAEGPNSQDHFLYELPSWVLNYAGHHPILRLINSSRPEEGQYYRGGGPMKAPNSIAGARVHGSLEIYGSFCGKIVSASDRVPDWGEYEKIMGTAEQFRRHFLLVTETKDLLNNQNEEEFWRVIVGDLYDESPDVRKRIEWNAQARSNLLQDINLAKVSKMPTRLLQTVRLTLVGTNFCTTTSNSVAVVYGNVQVGDDIFIARGAALPFIIRAVKNNGSTDAVGSTHNTSRLYSFVGGSYVHGSMDGQILEEREAKGIPDETVVLV